MTDLSTHELRLRVFEALRHAPNTQWQNFVQYQLTDALGRSPSGDEKRMAREILHELMNAGMLMPGSNADDGGWPFFSLTSHGHALLSQTGPPVYDYDGYLAELRRVAPTLDDVVLTYLSESLQAYHRSLPLSSLVLLACASERLIRLLIDAYVESIADPNNQRALRQRLEARDISTAFDRFSDSFKSTRHQVSPAAVPNDFELHVEGVFTFIRLIRNNIIHATSRPTVTPAIVYANLQQFSYYAATITTLISWYQQNKTTV